MLSGQEPSTGHPDRDSVSVRVLRAGQCRLFQCHDDYGSPSVLRRCRGEWNRRDTRPVEVVMDVFTVLV